MNKKRLKLKRRKDTVRVSYEPDYDHEAWASDAQPTPETEPDAFYKRTEPAHPQAPVPETRRKPHRSLTTSMLRRRLYNAGVKGAEAKRMLIEIRAGEQDAGGVAIPKGWSVSGFRKRFGQRVARAVLRFVHVAFIMIDEGWKLLQSSNGSFIEKAMREGRKYSAVPVVVKQTMPMPAVMVAQRVSFHH